MYITMGTAVYGYISYEFLGLFEALYGGTVFMVSERSRTREGTKEDC